MKTRIPIIAGNWKMYKTIGQAREFIQKLAKVLPPIPTRVFIAPSYTAIQAAAEVAFATKIVIGAQNMHEADAGAFTGAVSASMLKDAGARFVILGHSERRHIFHETNLLINQKIKRAVQDGLIPILCIGETQKERDAKETKKILHLQLEECLKEISPKEIVIAYEPVWAIGTGKTATPEMAEEAHLLCREFLNTLWGKSTSERLNILYGGSVTPETAPSLLKQPNIDGALVGGASLHVDKFLQIIGSS